MSGSGRALAQAINQFGQSFQQMGETIYKVEADNEFRNQSLAIADGIEKFNTSLLTDPDHGTPGANEGYMKKWEDYKKSIDTQIQQVKNPLAKKSLEGYVTQVATKQHEAIYSMQFDRWSQQMVVDGEKRISAIMAQAGMPVEVKMFAVTEELDSLQAKNLIQPGKRAEIQTKYLKQIASDEFIKKTQSIIMTSGSAAAREYILTAGFESYKIGDEFVSVDTGDIEKALSYVRIRGTDLGDKEFTIAYDKLLAGTFTETEKNILLASENVSDSQKSTILREYYSRNGESDAIDAIIGIGNFTRMANGESNVGKITTWADIENLAKNKKIDASTLSYLQGQYNAAKNIIKKNNEDQAWVSVMLDITDGKVKDITEAIKRGSAIGKAEEARVLFLQTTAKNTTDATIKANNDATDTLSSLENKVIAKTATFDDFESATASFKANKDLLGEAYPSVIGKLQSLRWKFTDVISETTRASLEKRLRNDPDSVSDDEIWGLNISGADSSYLASLKLQSKDRALLTENDKALMKAADLYAVNEKIKRGEVLGDGEKALTRRDLEGMKDYLASAAYVKYSELLDRDEAESVGMKEYWDYYAKIESGTANQDDIMKDKKLSFSMKADLLNRHATRTGNDEQKMISKLALNLVRKLNGENIGDDKFLTYADLATIKDPQAHQLAVNAIADSVKFLKAKGNGERFLAAYKEIVEGKTTNGVSILENKSLEPDEAIELYGFFISSADKKEETERGVVSKQVFDKFQIAKATAMNTLKEGQKPVSINEFKEFVASFDEKQLPLNVRKLFDDAADNLDSTTAADRLSRKIREAGALWVENGSFTKEDEQKITAEIEAAPLTDKDWARAMVQTYKNNAQAVARQKADDAWIQSQRTRTAEEQEAEDTRKAQAEARKVAAARLLDEFKVKLGKGMTEDEYLGFQARYIEVFKDAPEEFSSAFRLADVLYAGVTDKEYAKKESTLSSAFNELVSSNTIEGYKAIGEVLSMAMINKVFPTDSKMDVKGREYWAEKLQNFQRSDQANKVARTNAKTSLIEARTRSWDVVTGVAKYDPSAVYLDESLIKLKYPYLSAEERDSFHNDLSQIARATEAKAEAERRAEAGTSATANEKALGNAAYTILEGVANILEYQTKTMAATSTSVTYTNKAGKVITKTVTPELFEEIKKEFADDMILSGDWGKAEGLALKFTSSVKDPIWAPVYNEIIKLEKSGKPISVETRAFIDRAIAANHNPDTKAIEALVAQVRDNTIKINLSKTFDLMEKKPDVSEDYLTGIYSGKWNIFMNSDGKNSTPIHKEFEEVLKTWSAKTLSTINAFATKGVLIEGKNASREVFGNGHVQFRVKDKTVLSNAGVIGNEAVFYLGFYGSDALPIVEVKTGNTTIVKAWIPWERQYGTTAQGRWVIVESYATNDGSIRYRKTQEQISLDKTMPVEKVQPDSISATQDYPAFH